MKPPPLLLGATLLFWGWQTEFLLAGALMGVILEGARVFKVRWELSDEDFGRVWTFCTVLLLATALYAFTANEGPSSFGRLFEDANLVAQRNASISGARTIVSILRWLPMIFFPFLAAQAFSTREAVPLATISLILQRRWKKAKRLGQVPPERNVHIGFTYFSGTLFSSSFHAAEDQSFFWGVCVLLSWALWTHRSRRFALPVWIGAVAVAVLAGYYGQLGIAKLQRHVDFLNPQWFARFLRRPSDPSQSRTALGRVGSLKESGAIVVRVEPREGHPAPAYLRDASYRVYRVQTWYAGTSRNDFQPVSEDPPVESASWTLVPGKTTNLSVVRIACYLEGYEDGSPAGLLPLPPGTARLENLPAYVLQKNSAGAVLAQGPGLVIFDAFHGPGATMDAPPDSEQRPRRASEQTDIPPAPNTNSDTADTDPQRARPPPGMPGNEDLGVSLREVDAIEQVIGELQLRGRSLPEVLRRLEGFFADQFTYRKWQPRAARGTETLSPLGWFLLESRAGHCEYFASATVLLLRQLGFPARYATGYMVHETSGNGYVVRLRDAHAWTLVWDPEARAWKDFDTTPGSWIQEEMKNQSSWRKLADAWSRVVFEFSKVRWGQSRLREYLLWVVIPGLALLLYQILFRRGRRRRPKPKSDEDFLTNWPGLDSEFYKLEQEIARRGVPRGDSEPLNEWLRRVAATPAFANLHEPLRQLLRLHYRYRFDPLGLNPDERKTLHEQTRACLERLVEREPSLATAEK